MRKTETKPLGDHWRRRMQLLVDDVLNDVPEYAKRSLSRMIIRDGRLEASQSPGIADRQMRSLNQR